MKRRKFFQFSMISAIAWTGLGTSKKPTQEVPARGSGGLLARRDLGRTGEKLSIIGLGGLVLTEETQERANEIVRDAFEAGINYFDVAPSYGNAEDRLGPALRPFRKSVFLACKTQKRDRSGAEDELNRSLKKLNAGHFDLYQLHALTTAEDVKQVFGPNGALEAFRRARDAGKIRFIGFSAHSEKAALAAMDGFDFDTILFPFNFVCYLKAGFGPAVLERAREKKMGILALKSMARQPWSNDEGKKQWPKAWYQPLSDPGEADLGLRFTLSLPVTAAVPPGDSRLFYQALKIARAFKPLSPDEQIRIKTLAANLNPLFE
jgi:aryl-alcohol dehydrogenase-like predicted oxidoreductase